MTADSHSGASPSGLPGVLDKWLAGHESDLIDTRHDLHRHPEVAHEEHRTTDLIVRRLKDAGLSGAVLSSGTGVICDIGSGGRVVALRSDIDALPLPDLKDVPYRSEAPGVCHACGHDAHTAIVLATAEVLAELAADGGLPGTVRPLFQPAEETCREGRSTSSPTSGCADVDRSTRCTAIRGSASGTSGCGRGRSLLRPTASRSVSPVPVGTPGRPHLTSELVYALGRVITDLPGLLSRRIDPRAGLSMVWGSVQAGQVGNAIPSSGVARGTIRLLDRNAWDGAESVVRTLVEQMSCPPAHTPRSSTFEACRPSSTTRRRWTCSARRSSRRWARRPSPGPSRAWAGRISPGTSIMLPAPSPGSACTRRGRSGSTCTSRPSTSTSAHWRSACGS